MTIRAYRFEPYHIVIGGIFASLAFVGFEVIASAVARGAESSLAPLHGFGAVLVGGDASRLNSRDLLALVVGAGLLVLLSIECAFAFAAATAIVLYRLPLVLLGIAFGVVLWFAVIYVVRPMLDERWLPEGNEPAVQFVAFVLFYGLPLGWYLARRQRITVAEDYDANRPRRGSSVR